MILNIFIIQFILVAAIDYLGFVEEGIEPLFRKITGFKIGKIGRPFSCSTCMTFWVSLLYVLLTGNISLLNIGVCMLAAIMTPIVLNIIHTGIDFAQNIIGLFRYITGLDLK